MKQWKLKVHAESRRIQERGSDMRKVHGLEQEKEVELKGLEREVEETSLPKLPDGSNVITI